MESNFGHLSVKKESKEEAQVQFWDDTDRIRKYVKPRQTNQPLSPRESDISYESGESEESRP